MGLQVPLLVQVQIPAQFFPNLPLGHTVNKLQVSNLQSQSISQNPRPLGQEMTSSVTNPATHRLAVSSLQHPTHLIWTRFLQRHGARDLTKGPQTKRQYYISRTLTSQLLTQGFKNPSLY
jgi:hypothetical protein